MLAKIKDRCNEVIDKLIDFIFLQGRPIDPKIQQARQYYLWQKQILEETMKEKIATTNTHYEKVRGTLILKDQFVPLTLTVRFTSDEHGETLSIADDKQGLMLAVPFAKVEALIEETRADRKAELH